MKGLAHSVQTYLLHNWTIVCPPVQSVSFQLFRSSGTSSRSSRSYSSVYSPFFLATTVRSYPSILGAETLIQSTCPDLETSSIDLASSIQYSRVQYQAFIPRASSSRSSILRTSHSKHSIARVRSSRSVPTSNIQFQVSVSIPFLRGTRNF